MKRIEEVCRLSGVSRRTLQYYDNEGILSVKRSEENYRLYDEKYIYKYGRDFFGTKRKNTI